MKQIARGSSEHHYQVHATGNRASEKNLNLVLLAVTAVLVLITQRAPAVVVYQTGFEFREGYNTNLDLSGQLGWIGETAGGNGIVDGWFPGKGQQAYVGFSPPTNGDTAVFVYQPLNKNVSQAQFNVTMEIMDSSNTNWDDFYWSVYNQQGQQLFTLDFDNSALGLYYYLDGVTNRFSSGVSFTNGIIYRLSMNLDFSANRWSASFGGALVATNKPIASAGTALNLGDFDAAWAIYDPNAPGDNFMLFDDYQVTGSVPPPLLMISGMSNGVPILHMTGASGNRFAIEASTNLLSWSALKTNVSTGGSLNFVDNSATGFSRRLYRTRWVP